MSLTLPPGCTIRDFTYEDWMALWEIRRTQLLEYGVSASDIVLPVAPERGPLGSEVEDPYGELDVRHPDLVYLSGVGGLWLAYWESYPVGHVGAQDVGGAAVELRRMYVAAAYRRRGIASALVQVLVDHCRSHHVRMVELWTEADGVGRKLYETLGFAVVSAPGAEFNRSLKPWDFVPGPAEIRMRLDLQ